MPLSDYNPRFLAYCKASGFENDPKGMITHDTKRWPGGKMIGFILWIQRRLRDYRAEHPNIPTLPVLDAGYKTFDAWLTTWRR